MKTLILIATTFIFTVKMNAQILLSEDFEGESFANITTIAGPLYQTDNTPDGDCTTSDRWDVDNDGEYEASGGFGPYLIPSAAYTGKYAEIDFGPSSCAQDFTMIVGTFLPTQTTIDISYTFDYSHFTSGSLTVQLYNETTSSVASTLATYTADADGAETFSPSVTIGQSYSLRFTYSDSYAYGAAIDNIVIQHDCAPSATFTQNCASDLTYSVDVNITSLNGNTSANIKSGGTTYFTGVGVGTYTVSDLDGSATITVESTDNSVCIISNSFGACDVCSSTSKPSDFPCSAPSVDLSQAFYGSTACGYTVDAGGSYGGPDDFCGSSDNDSWLKFTATADTVKLDWETIYDAIDCDRGVQYAVFDGSCGSQDAMVSLACFNPPATFQGTGRFTIPDGSFGSVPLTVGDEYYIYIDGYAGDLCTYSWTPISGVAVLPPNDLCPDTARIVCGESATASIILATATDAPSSCSGGGTPGKGVWYVVDGQGNDITVSTDNSGTNFDTQINIYSGSCGSFTCVAGDDDSGTGTTSELTFTAASGITYYIYVDGDGVAEGQFEISLSCVACPADAGTWD